MIDSAKREKEVLALREQGFSYTEIGRQLNISKSLVAFYAKKQLNQENVLRKLIKTNSDIEYERIVCDMVSQARNMNDLCKLMNKRATNNNYVFFEKIIKKYGLNTSHFSATPMPTHNSMKLTFEEKFSYRKNFVGSVTRLKDELLKLGIKEHRCECCDNTEWNGKEVPLQLHHINGDRRDNRIENLQLLCPNCHAQTDTFAGRNKSKKKYTCICCGKKFYKGDGSSKHSTIYCSIECRDKMSGNRNQYVHKKFKEEKDVGIL